MTSQDSSDPSFNGFQRPRNDEQHHLNNNDSNKTTRLSRSSPSCPTLTKLKTRCSAPISSDRNMTTSLRSTEFHRLKPLETYNGCCHHFNNPHSIPQFCTTRLTPLNDFTSEGHRFFRPFYLLCSVLASIFANPNFIRSSNTLLLLLLCIISIGASWNASRLVLCCSGIPPFDISLRFYRIIAVASGFLTLLNFKPRNIRQPLLSRSSSFPSNHQVGKIHNTELLETSIQRFHNQDKELCEMGIKRRLRRQRSDYSSEVFSEDHSDVSLSTLTHVQFEGKQSNVIQDINEQEQESERLRTETDCLRVQLEKMKKLREDERIGRTRAEQQLRTQLNNLIEAEGGFRFPSIGIVTASYQDRRGTPRQSLLASKSLSTIHLQADIAACFKDITLGLEGFSHLWIIYVFHCNTNLTKTALNHKNKRSTRTPFSAKDKNHDGLTCSANQPNETNSSALEDLATSSDWHPFLTAVGTFSRLKAKVHPPRKSDNEAVGVFACRSPHRPNPIGLSIARLISLDYEQRKIIVSGLDAIEGTPIIDIKPYISHCDCIERSICPDWVTKSYSSPPFEVVLTNEAKQQIELLRTQLNTKWLDPYSTLDDLISVIYEILSNEIRSSHQVHLSKSNEINNSNSVIPSSYNFTFHKLHINYTIDVDGQQQQQSQSSFCQTDYTFHSLPKRSTRIQILSIRL